jgi:hypothetical protein
MAIVLNQQQEQEKQEQSQQQPMLPGATPMSSSGGQMAAVPAGRQQQRPASSGQFTNVQRFIQANQGVGNQIAQRMGETTSRGLEKVGQGVGQLTGLKQEVGQERERIGQADAVANQIRGNVQELTTGPQFDQARQLITGQTAADQQRQQLQGISDPLQTNISRAQQQISQLGSEPGRFNLLRQVIGAPSYTAGQQRLDQLLTQTEGGRTLGQQFQQQRGQLGSQTAQSEDLMNRISGGISEYGQQAAQASQMLTGLLGSEIGGVQQRGRTALEQEAARRQEDENLLRRYFAGEFSSPQLNAPPGATMKMQAVSPELERVNQLLNQVGFTPGQRTFGTLANRQLGEIFTGFGSRPERIQQVLSDEEIARFNALQQLSGSADRMSKEQLTGLGLNQQVAQEIEDKQKQFQNLISGGVEGVYTWGAEGDSGLINTGSGTSGGSFGRTYSARDIYSPTVDSLDRLLGTAFGVDPTKLTQRDLGGPRFEVKPFDSLRTGVVNLSNQLQNLGYFNTSMDPFAPQKTREQFVADTLNRIYTRANELALQNELNKARSSLGGLLTQNPTGRNEIMGRGIAINSLNNRIPQLELALENNRKQLQQMLGQVPNLPTKRG